jgi:O-antigen/teichoic acid export membrane protein
MKLFSKIPLIAHNVSLINNIGILALSSILSRLVLFVRDFMLAAVLGPISYGVWIQFVVFFNYALHLPLGFQHVMSRDVPYYVGKRNFKRVSLIQNITFFVTLITAILAGFFFIISNSYSNCLYDSYCTTAK